MRFKHFRAHVSKYGCGPDPGSTIAWDVDRKIYAVSVCSRKDNFCRRDGRDEAEARASRALEMRLVCGIPENIPVLLLPIVSGKKNGYCMSYVDAAERFSRELIGRQPFVIVDEVRDV